MKTLFRLIVLICTLFLLTSCMQKDPTFRPTGNDSLELTKLSSKGVTDQQPADQAREFLSNYEEVASVRAVNDDGKLLIGVEVHHHDRFSLDNIEKELRKAVKRNYRDMDITLSTDKKILIELAQLETDMMNQKISKDDIKQKLRELIKLSKEQT